MNSPSLARRLSLSRHLAAEAHNNAWSNHRLLKACCELTPEEFVAPRTSFFPSIKATLNHILTVDWYYVEVLERSLAGLPPAENPRRHFDPREPFEACADLSREQRAVDRRLVALCESLTDERLALPVLLPRRDGVVRDTMQRILAHLFQHQIHHRGQAHAMLCGTGVAPPQLDEFFSIGEAPLRAGEFAALGWTEERVWGGAR
jgi:uncharacterized damage-inducible protein DinB